MSNLYSISIRKARTDNALFTWSNVYHTNQDSLTGAIGCANTLVATEVLLHTPSVRFFAAHIEQHLTPTESTTIPYDQLGEYPSASEMIPAFVAVRVDFVPSLAGRAGRKFYHMIVEESMQYNGILDTTVKDNLQAVFNDLDWSALNLCSANGLHAYSEARVQLALTQHQFKRKWARRGGP